MVLRVGCARVAEDLQSGSLGIIDQEERHAIVRRDIAGRDQLAVAAQVRKRERRRPDRLQKSRLAAAMLDVRPAMLADGGQVETVARADELALVEAERIA